MGRITGYKDVTPKSKEALMSAVAQQPVAVCVDAGAAWFLYNGGVLSGPCTTDCEHMVLVVGYGHDPRGGDFWRVKNSWGTSWGMEGYILLARGKGGLGECGIFNRPTFPVVTGANVMYA